MTNLKVKIIKNKNVYFMKNYNKSFNNSNSKNKNKLNEKKTLKIKLILSRKDKYFFMIVLRIQILNKDKKKFNKSYSK